MCISRFCSGSWINSWKPDVKQKKMTLMLFDHLISEVLYGWTQITFTVHQNQIPPTSLLQSRSVHLSSLRSTACVRPIIMVEKIILPLIQTMVQRLCLDHFSRHLRLTEPAEQRWLYLQRPDSEEQLKKNHPGTATVFITFLCLITAQFLLEIQLQLSSTWAGFWWH